MPNPKPLRRSVSPFGLNPTNASSSEFEDVQQAFSDVFGQPADGVPHVLEKFEDAVFFPSLLESTAHAAANDAVHLDKLCRFALTHRVDFEAKELQSVVFQAMEKVFLQKTELFLSSQKSDATSERPSVLFSKERDFLIGHYFYPVCETTPADFSGFVQRWISSENRDRVLHFFDFSLGAHSPTFEHYLVFAHPGLKRVVSNKTQLRVLWKTVEPMAEKLAGLSWKKLVVAELGL